MCEIVKTYQKCEKLNYFDKTLMYYVQYYLPDLVCARADRAGMLNSLEIRSPFLNHKLVEYIASISSSEKWQCNSFSIAWNNLENLYTSVWWPPSPCVSCFFVSEELWIFLSNSDLWRQYFIFSFSDFFFLL